jgi:hypothetical protein
LPCVDKTGSVVSLYETKTSGCSVSQMADSRLESGSSGFGTVDWRTSICSVDLTVLRTGAGNGTAVESSPHHDTFPRG